MLKNVEIPENATIEEWDPPYEEIIIWVYEQCMGETDHGDTLLFKEMRCGAAALSCGVLLSADRSIKAVLPIDFTNDRGTEYINVTYEEGFEKRSKKDDTLLESDSSITIDDAAKRFFEGEDVWF